MVEMSPKSVFPVYTIDFEFHDLGEFFTITTGSDAADEWIKNRDKLPGCLRNNEKYKIYANREEALALMG